MSGRLISQIYFYLISAIAIVLLIIGMYNSVNLAVNLTQYDEYPLRYGGAERCMYPATVVEKPLPENGESSKMSQAEQEQQKKQCEESLAYERKQHKVDDIKNAIAFTLIGAVLFAIHFPIALRRSREK